MRRILLGGVVVLLVGVVFVVVGSYTFLQGIFEDRVATSIQDDYNLAEKPEVELESESGPRMLMGYFTGGEIVMDQANFGGFTAETVTIGLSPFDVDVPGSVRNGELVADGQETGPIEVVVSEQEVQRLASLEADIEGVELEDGQVVIRRSPALMQGVELPLEVRGELSLVGQNELAFRPEEISVAGMGLPPAAEETLFEQAEVTFPLEDVPEGVTLDTVEVEGDRLVINGQTETGLGGA